MMNPTIVWCKVHRNRYELVRDGRVAAAVNAYRPPNNSHIAIWSVEIDGRKLMGAQPYFKDAKRIAERESGIVTQDS